MLKMNNHELESKNIKVIHDPTGKEMLKIASVLKFRTTKDRIGRIIPDDFSTENEIWNIRKTSKYNNFGQPVIDRLWKDDFQKNWVFFCNFPFSFTDESITKMFKKAGEIKSISFEAKRGGDGSGTSGRGQVEYYNARDATRAIIMYDLTKHGDEGKKVKVSPTKYEKLTLMDGLSDLGRWTSEIVLGDQFIQDTQGRVNPFTPIRLFCFVGHDNDEETVKDIFRNVGYVNRVQTMTKKGTTDEHTGHALIVMSSGIDALQAIGILNNAKFR